jgi:hypothetical protein
MAGFDKRVVFIKGAGGNLSFASSFVYDYNTNSLGINTNSPVYNLDVKGTARVSNELVLGADFDLGFDTFTIRDTYETGGFSPNVAQYTTPFDSNIMYITTETGKNFDYLQLGTFSSTNPIFALFSGNQVNNEYVAMGYGFAGPRTFVMIGSDGNDANATPEDFGGTNMFIASGSGGTATTGGNGGDIFLLANSAGGTGDNNGGSIYFGLGNATGAGRSGILSSAGGNIPWKNNPAYVFRIEGGSTTQALTFDHDGTDAIYSTTSGIHNFQQDVKVNGKLTVTGSIDPTDLTLESAGSNAFIEQGAGELAAVSAANKGRIIYDSVSQNFKVSQNTSTYVDILTTGSTSTTSGVIKIWSQGTITGVNNTTTETSLITSGSGNLTLPADFITSGCNLRIKIFGVISTVAVLRTGTLRIKIGTDVFPYAIIPSATLATDTLDDDFLLAIDSAGVAANAYAINKFTQTQSSSSANQKCQGDTSNTVMDTTVAKTIDITWQWDNADPSNNLGVFGITIEALK